MTTPGCDAGPGGNARLSQALIMPVPLRQLTAEQETHLASWTQGT